MRKRDKEPAAIPAEMQERINKTLAQYRPQQRSVATPARTSTPPPQPSIATPQKELPVSPRQPMSTGMSTPLKSPEYKRARALASLESLPSSDKLPQLPQFAPSTSGQGIRHVDTQSTIDASLLGQMSQLSLMEGQIHLKLVCVIPDFIGKCAGSGNGDVACDICGTSCGVKDILSKARVLTSMP